jgi:predicted Zn-dependent protease
MLLAGQGAGVLFHEVLGHPLEGERQRAEEQAQTFKGKVGERILADFIDIVFDPTVPTLGDVPLSGAYRFDDEGVKARPVVAVEKGVLRSFLLSRRPIAGFPRSNGHGRSEGMPLPVARQSNLFVKTSAPRTEAVLRQKLVDLARARGLAYGLYVATVERGATRTSRGEPNAFNVVPREVYKVWVDGRPDQLIRGVELVGTPLAALLKIAAAGDRPETFNGVCGAESGWVPVSASSPMLLFEEIEVQRAAKSSEREPVLPPPGAEETTR